MPAVAVAPSPQNLEQIRQILNGVGGRLSQDESDVQLQTIRDQYTHGIGQYPNCRDAGAHHVDDLTPQNSQAFKAAIVETLLRNETGADRRGMLTVVPFYRLNVPLGEDDGPAFGPPQWTVSLRDRMTILVNILGANPGWTAADLDQVRNLFQRPMRSFRDEIWDHAGFDRDAIRRLVERINNTLLAEGQRGINNTNRVWTSYYGYTDNQHRYHAGELDTGVITPLSNFVTRLRSNEATRRVAEYIDSHAELAIAIADRVNQWGARFLDRNGDLERTIRAAVSGPNGSFDIADFYQWVQDNGGICGAQRRLNSVDAVARDCGFTNRSVEENNRIRGILAAAHCARGHPLSIDEIQTAYDQVRQDLAAAAPPVNSQIFQIGTAQVLAYYGPGTYSNSSNCWFVGIAAIGSAGAAGYRAAQAAGYAVINPQDLNYGTGDNVYTRAYIINAPTPALAEGQKLLSIFETAIAAAQGLPNPNDQIGSHAVFPGTTIPLPVSVVDAALAPHWPSIMPLVAEQASQQDPPTLVMDLDGANGQIIPPRGPFDTGWLAPGDGLLVDDGSTIRSVTADGPGETVLAFNGDATLDGTPGNDFLWAGAGNDTLIGGPGDSLHGGAGNDVFVSGPNDVMYGGGGTNTFQVNRGVGSVTIYANGNGADTLALGADVDPGDVRIIQDGPHLLLKIRPADEQTGAADHIRLVNQVADGATQGPYPLNKVTFADGTVWDAAKLQAKSLIATEPGQVIIGFSGMETLVGRTGGDTLWAGSGTDTLLGGPNDVMYGGPGTDVFLSGRNNTIFAGTGTNTVKFERQDGQDTINGDAGGTTTVELGTGIKPLDLVFALQPNAAHGDDLHVLVQGPSDDFGRGDDRGGHSDHDIKSRKAAGITVPNWNVATGSSGAQTPVATFATKDAELAGADVGLLIQAMATFTTDTGMSWEQAIEERPGAVKDILARHWHSTKSPEEPGGWADHGDHGHGWSR